LDNQRVAILALVVSICLCTLLFLFFRSHPSRTHRGTDTDKKLTRETGRKSPPRTGTGKPGALGTASRPDASPRDPDQDALPGRELVPLGGPTTGTSHGNGGLPPLETTSAQPAVPPVTLTPDTMAQLEEKAGRIRSHRRKMAEASEKWLREKLEDESMTEKTKEVYRLRLLPDMKEGLALLESKDYQGALRSFEKALNDPDATPVSKHLIYDYMLQASAKLQNKLLFANLFKQQAMLQRDNDLGVLGLDKSGDAYAYAEYMNEHLVAANDEATFNRIVERDMKEIGATPADRDACVADAKKRIREFEGYFDDRRN